MLWGEGFIPWYEDGVCRSSLARNKICLQKFPTPWAYQFLIFFPLKVLTRLHYWKCSYPRTAVEREALVGGRRWRLMGVMPSRREAGQALGVGGCGPEAGERQRGAVAASRVWGASPGFRSCTTFSSLGMLLNLSCTFFLWNVEHSLPPGQYDSFEDYLRSACKVFGARLSINYHEEWDQAKRLIAPAFTALQEESCYFF